MKILFKSRWQKINMETNLLHWDYIYCFLSVFKSIQYISKLEFYNIASDDQAKDAG